MTEQHAKRAMEGLALRGSRASLPNFAELWTRGRLESEFARRSRLAAHLDWIEAALQSAAGLTLAALLVWLGGG